MPKSSGSSFKFDLGAVGGLGDKLGNAIQRDNRVIKKRMQQATLMVWRIAHQKRPIISKAQAKAQGRSYRVSDPGASAGVPVRTGALQGSIQQSVTANGLMSYVGKIWTKGIEYAGFIEYGTSRMAARPFMRPAINLTKDAIKKLFSLKIDSNL